MVSRNWVLSCWESKIRVIDNLGSIIEPADVRPTTSIVATGLYTQPYT